jgi:hypothetical protein
MTGYDRANCWHIKSSAWQKTAIGLLLFAIWTLSGCGGYHQPMATTMPGKTPKPYPMHRPKARYHEDNVQFNP